MFFRLPSSTAQSVAMFLSTVLTMLRSSVPPNIGQSPLAAGGSPASRATSRERSISQHAGSSALTERGESATGWPQPASIKKQPNQPTQRCISVSDYWNYCLLAIAYSLLPDITYSVSFVGTMGAMRTGL